MLDDKIKAGIRRHNLYRQAKNAPETIDERTRLEVVQHLSLVDRISKAQVMAKEQGQSEKE